MNDLIKLRPLMISDTQSVFEISSDSKATKFMRFDTHTDINQAKDLIEKYINSPNIAYAIIHKKQGFIGYISMSCSAKNEYSLSTILSPKAWNKGYSTHVLAELLKISKTNGVKKLSAYVIDSNIASCKVLEKNGFKIIEFKTFKDFDGRLNIYEYNF